MKKIDCEKAIELSKKLNRFSYFSNPFYLYANCMWENREGEDIVFETEVSDSKSSLLFLPKKVENAKGQRIGTAFEEDLKKIEEMGLRILQKQVIGIEYFYRTNDLINLEGSKFKSFRNEIRLFQKSYQFKIFADYQKEKIIEFMQEWIAQKKTDDKSELTKKLLESELENCKDYLKILDKIHHKKIFVEIDGKLAGFAVFLPFHEDLWAMLIQKANYKYKGLNKFIYHLASKEMEKIEFMTNAAEAQDKGLARFKESLNPTMKKEIYLVSIK